MNEEYIVSEDQLDWFLDIWDEERLPEDFANPSETLSSGATESP